MVITLRHTLKVGLAALLLSGTVMAPAMAADSSSPDAANYQSVVTSIQPAVPGLQVKVGAQNGTVTVVNGTGKTVTVVGYTNEDYLRITPSGVEENANSLTATINASPSLDKMSANMASAMAQPANWVHKSNTPSATWKDYRVQWTNKQRPPIVVADPHNQHTVFTWAVNLKVDNQPVLALGEVRWTGTPWLSTTQIILLVVGGAALLIAAFMFIKSRRNPRRRGRRSTSPAPARGRAPVPSRGY
ncbi:MAG TPA: hypothetical protein VFP72_03790 [Kineosporiaceae bacterium]|nr:hypothetical protein [Kineosporiaceae bacterium]